MRLDLDDYIPGCEYFKWHEVLLLREWRIHVYPDPFQYKNLILVSQKLDLIRKRFGKPISVTSGLRPISYNKLIGGAGASQHIKGKALDFKVKHTSCDLVRRRLSGELGELGLRMENLPGSNWIHIDIKAPGKGARYFRP